MPTRQVDILGGDAQPAAIALTHPGRDIIEIGHGRDVDPSLRHGDHDIGAAKAEWRQQFHGAVSIGNLLADEIFAGDTEMGLTSGELGDDFRGREIGDLDIGQAFDAPAIFARRRGPARG